MNDAGVDWTAAFPVRLPELEAHYAEVRAFQHERTRRAQQSSRLAWSFFSAALVAIVALAIAVAILLPQQRLIPLLLFVRSDGTVDSASSISDLPASQSEAVIRAAIWSFTKARESYSFADARGRYDLVTAMSGPNVLDAYQKWFIQDKDTSPQYRIGRKGQIDVAKIGLSFVQPQVALVRFWKTTTLYGEKPEKKTWSATVGFDLVERMAAAARLVDPSGLKVTSYQSSEDSP